MIEKGYEDMRKAKKAEKARKKVAKPAAPTKPQKSTNINKDSKRKAPRKRTLKQNRVGILKMNEGGMVIVDRNYLKGR